MKSMSIARKCLSNTPKAELAVTVCNLRRLRPETTRALVTLAKAAFAEMERIKRSERGKRC